MNDYFTGNLRYYRFVNNIFVNCFQAAEAQKLAEEAAASVADANRILAETLAEVQKLKKEHLVEIKSLGSPPTAVKVTLGGVVILN